MGGSAPLNSEKPSHPCPCVAPKRLIDSRRLSRAGATPNCHADLHDCRPTHPDTAARFAAKRPGTWLFPRGLDLFPATRPAGRLWRIGLSAPLRRAWARAELFCRAVASGVRGRQAAARPVRRWRQRQSPRGQTVIRRQRSRSPSVPRRCQAPRPRRRRCVSACTDRPSRARS